MKQKIGLLTIIGLFTLCALALAVQNMGAEDVVLPGGKTGDVHFPHRIHQENLQDCNLCHDLFPQEPGSIEKLKEDGTLKKKQVMNHKCVKCHRDRKRDGETSGPTTCTSCHIKAGS